MIDAFAIGISIQLDDGILAALDGVYSKFDRVQGAVDAMNTALERTGGIITPLIGQASALAGAFSSAARAARAIQQAMADTNIPAGPGGAAGGGAGSAPAAPPGGWHPCWRRKRPGLVGWFRRGWRPASPHPRRFLLQR